MTDPSGWKLVPLGQVIRSAQSGFASGERAPDGVIQIRMNNVTTDGNLEWTSFIRVPTSPRQLSKYRLQPGDVLFNATNSPELVGKTAAFSGHSEPVVFSNHFVRLRADEKRLDSWYLARWLTHQQQQGRFESLCTQWVNQAAVRKDDLLSLRIPLPPLPEQQRIAGILARADRLRRLRRYALELSDSYLQSVFLEMFGDPVTNPMGWHLRKLGSIGTLDRGKSRHRPRNAPHLYGGPYPFVQTGDVANASGYILTYQQTYSEAGLAQSRLWPKGTLCITIAANIADTAVLTFDACFPDSVVGFHPGKETNVEFIQQWFSFLQWYLEVTAPEVAQKNINLKILREMDVALPPYESQCAFASIVRRYERLRAQQREAQRQAEHLFQTLLHQAFEGEL